MKIKVLLSHDHSPRPNEPREVEFSFEPELVGYPVELKIGGESFFLEKRDILALARALGE